MNPKQRDRGRILTPEGLSRLQRAIAAWELKHEVRCTQEKLRELTIAQKTPNGLDPGTISKILEAQKGVDPKSIRCLFKTLGLELDEADLISSARLQVQADPNFVGREGAIADLNLLVERGAKVIVIQARGGVGKTTLARKYLQQEFGSYLEFPIAKETKDIASIESLLEEKLRQLGEEPGREFFVSLDRLKRKLQAERLGILIDNLEPALDSAGKFIELHRRYVELLRVLADPSVQSTTLITTRERLRESSITAEHYMLRSLDIIAWEQFFQNRGLSTDVPALAALHNAYGGNAKAMDIIRGAILEDYSGDVEAYWQANQHDLFIERDLEDLVVQQFNRLQQIDVDAYNLLCRMGCYRYQDVPTLTSEGLLRLLWDLSESQQRRVVKSLQDRSLLEVESNQYWLHPVIRAEAINRLRDSIFWQEANSRAAEFWTTSVTKINGLEHALEALEAYYHYIEIEDYARASQVILQRRNHVLSEVGSFDNSAETSLASSFCILGIFQQILSAIHSIKDNVAYSLSTGHLLHKLGNLYLLTGNVSEAITFYERARKIGIEFCNLDLEAESLHHLGLCKTELWEVQEAIQLFEKVSLIAENTHVHEHAVLAWTRLAFFNSYLGNRRAAIRYINKIKKDLPRTNLRIRGIGYAMLELAATHKNLGEYEEAVEKYRQAIDYATETRFTHVKAIALTGLAGLNREQGNFDESLFYHSESIAILSEINAICGLAEAYYQLGLTYQVIGETHQSSENFKRALHLFDSMKAPKQVEKVKQAIIQNGK